jgi:hypothetical protein
MSTIGDALARKRTQLPQYDYLFRVDLPSVRSGSDTIITTDINHRVYSVDAPFMEYNDVKYTDRDKHWHGLDHRAMGSMSMRIDEFEDGKTLEYLLAWQSLFGDESGRNPPVNYKKDIRIVRLNSTLQDAHYHDYKGFFPLQIAPVSWNYDSNAALQYNVTFSGDNVIHTIVPLKTLVEELTGDTGLIGKISSIMEKIPSTVSEILDAIVGVDTSAIRSTQKTPFSIAGTSTNVEGMLTTAARSGFDAGVGVVKSKAMLKATSAASRSFGSIQKVSLSKQGNPFRGV